MKFELPPPLPEKTARRFRQAPAAPPEALPERVSQNDNGAAPAGDKKSAARLPVTASLPLESPPTVAAGFSPPKSKRFSATHIIAAVGMLALSLILLGSWIRSAKSPAGTAYVSSDNNRLYSAPTPTAHPQSQRIPTWDEIVADPRFQALSAERRLLVLDRYRDAITKRAIEMNGGGKLSDDDAKSISDWYVATKAKLNLQGNTTKASKVVPTVSAMPTLPQVNATPSATPTASVMRGALVYHVVNVANGDYLNIRSGAGSAYSVVGRLAAGAGNISSTGKTRKNGSTTWVFISAESISGWVNTDFLQPGDAKVTPPSPTPQAVESPPISEAEERAKYWENWGYHFDPNIYTASMMDQKAIDIDRAKYWESRGYHFDPDIYSALMMDQKVVDINRAKYWEGRGYHFDPNIYSALMMDQEVERIKSSH